MKVKYMTATPANTVDVTAIGHAIVDVLAKADEAFLDAHGIPKGGMTLIDEEAAEEMYGKMEPVAEVSGGSAANSIACISSLGGRAAFIGKVGSDPLGQTFQDNLKSIGVTFNSVPLVDGLPTGRCLINVTADAERSMATFLGAAGLVASDDVDDALVEGAAITFFEGYLFERENARAAFAKSCALAKASGRKTAITLSDAGVVERQKETLVSFITENLDIVLANEDEAKEFFGTDDLSAMADKASDICEIFVVTRSEKGSVILAKGQGPIVVDAVAPTQLLDSTGAGDAYAGGFLYGLARGLPLEQSGRLGSLSASEVISHFGARPEKNLKEMASESGLL